jgi:hypothetical protein
MKTGKLIGFGVLFILVAWIVLWAIGISNAEKKLYILGKAAQQNSEVVFDNTWKTIKSEAGVTEQYKESFREIYVELMDARYKNDKGAGQQTLMKWVQENHPQFDSGLYGKLMNTIEGSRNSFTVEQKKLIDIDREHKSMKAIFPNSLIIGGRPDLDIKLVTSGKTKEAFSTGEENDIDPFAKN